MLSTRGHGAGGGPLRTVVDNNPFTLRVGQVFTGFGVGCGIGIGVGSPFNLGAIHPSLGSMAGQASSSFSGIRYQVELMVKKMGIKNVKVGIGCGVGLGHGFGVGVTLKPGATERVKKVIEQCVLAVNERLKMATANPDSQENSRPNVTPSLSPVAESGPQDFFAQNTSAPLQSDRLLGGLLQNPLSSPAVATTEPRSGHATEVDRLQTENQILRTLLMHHEQLEELKKENAALRLALGEDQDRSLSLKSESSSGNSGVKTSEGTMDKGKCFDCRRRSRQHGSSGIL